MTGIEKLREYAENLKWRRMTSDDGVLHSWTADRCPRDGDGACAAIKVR